MTRTVRSLVAALAAGALAVAAFVPVADSAPTALKVDNVHSTLLFKVKHMNVAFFYGRFDKFSGEVAMDAANAAATSVTFEADADSVDTNSENRDTHLKSPDFFNAAQFPKISFASTVVKASGTDAWDVTGSLTMHGVTKPVTVHMTKSGEATDKRMGHVLGFEGTFTVKRTDFGMSYGIPGVADEVALILEIEAKVG